MMPYHSVAEMTPEAILAYYDEMGFYDWEQPGTGTKMLKAQHPELETWSYGKHAAMLSCADCHMPSVKTESGVAYRPGEGYPDKGDSPGDRSRQQAIRSEG